MMIGIQAIAVLALGSLWAGQSESSEAEAEPLPAGAIYDADPSHLWNRVHRTFFVRPDADGDSANIDAVDPPLWLNTSRFLDEGSSHQAAIEVLDEFLDDDGHTLIGDPLKRAVL